MYDAIDDPYTYENSTVLVNKYDLRDQFNCAPSL
jgi:cell filamentation protein